MDILPNQHDSPHINEFDVVPPSPLSAQRDLEPHQSPFAQDLSFGNSLGSPSFNGSYHSPYSVHSELSYVGDHDINFNIIQDDSDIGLGLRTDYDPTDFDAPHTSSSSLLIYNDNDYMPHYSTLSASSTDLRNNGPHDHSSPSSNASANDDPGDRRSRASSVSSNNAIPYSPSPRLEVAQSFENLTFHSPNWGTEPLPRVSHSPIPQKPTSPPRLLMPDNYPPDAQAPPKINAPEGDGGFGPHFNIVPATPVSGVGTAGNSVTFQTTLQTLHQGSTLGLQSHQWHGVDQQSTTATGQSSNSVPPEHEFTFPPQSTHNHDNTINSSATSVSTSRLGHVSDDNAVASGSGYLFLPSQRIRSKSDTSRELPTWDQAFIQQQQRQAQNMDGGPIADERTVNMNDVLPGAQQSQLNQAFTFGQGGTKSNNNNNNNNFLSPDLNPIRRVKSDTGARPVHHRQSRSEDIRGSNLIPPPSHPSHQHSQSQSSGQFLFPPGQMDFLTPNQQPFYNGSTGSPDGPLPPISSISPGQRPVSPGHPLVSSPGHMRRASSGTRSERGAETWSGPGGPPLVTSRVSPYPSPHASPRPRYDELPQDDTSVRMGLEYVGANFTSGSGLLGVDGFAASQQQPPQGYGPGYSYSGTYTPSSTGASAYHTPGASPSPAPPLTLDSSVPKPNVTTGRTANASHKRRKQEATFVCPIPACGSTFTRSFNLKGHIRSHNEEKPFQCPWPGCGKGFARQHDCKRHEQLHTNYRPFNCEGCGKQFARMDALNRHLRSEGGADCMKQQGANGSMTGLQNDNGDDLEDSKEGVGGVKVEEKKNWGSAVAL